MCFLFFWFNLSVLWARGWFLTLLNGRPEMSSRHSSSVGPTGITGWLFGGSQKIVANHIADGSEGDDGPQMDVEVHQRPHGDHSRSVSSYDMGSAPPSASLLSSYSGTLLSPAFATLCYLNSILPEFSRKRWGDIVLFSCWQHRYRWRIFCP